MMHVRVWRTMESITVEITCHHAEGQTGGSHLVYRSVEHDCSQDPSELLSVLSSAAFGAAQQDFQFADLGMTDECGW